MTNKNTIGEEELTDNIYKSMRSRRSFFQKTALAGAGLALGSLTGLSAFASHREEQGLSDGDVAILSCRYSYQDKW